MPSHCHRAETVAPSARLGLRRHGERRLSGEGVLGGGGGGLPLAQRELEDSNEMLLRHSGRVVEEEEQRRESAPLAQRGQQ